MVFLRLNCFPLPINNSSTVDDTSVPPPGTKFALWWSPYYPIRLHSFRQVQIIEQASQQLLSQASAPDIKHQLSAGSLEVTYGRLFCISLAEQLVLLRSKIHLSMDNSLSQAKLRLPVLDLQFLHFYTHRLPQSQPGQHGILHLQSH